MFPLLLYLVCFYVHDWPSTCLFRMDHHVARDIRASAERSDTGCVGPTFSSGRACIRGNTSITRAQSPDRLDQEVTSFENLPPSFKVRQIPDVDMVARGLRPFQTITKMCPRRTSRTMVALCFRANQSILRRGGAGWYCTLQYRTECTAS
jgi:hypothetical protein